MKILLLILLALLQQLHALISITPVEISASPGLSVNIETGLETKRGNTHKDNYKASTRVTYDNNLSYVTWAELSGEYGETNDIENTNKIYSHLRYIHKLSDNIVRWELFYQNQEDKFKSIKVRRVSGAGLRFNMFDTLTETKGYFGVGVFNEYIRYIDTKLNLNENNIRLNTYLAYSLKFNNKSTLAYTLYYQPNIENFNDYVVSNMFELKLNIYQKLFLKFTISYDIDSSVAYDVTSDYDFIQNTSFVYSF